MEAGEGTETGTARGRRLVSVSVGPTGHWEAGMAPSGVRELGLYAPTPTGIARALPEEGGMTLSEGLSAAEAVPREG